MPGDVTVSKACHAHIAIDHPLEYATIMAALPGIIADPAFIGRDPKHPHTFYLIDALPNPAGPFVLVAIGFVRTPNATYAVKSAYGLKASQLTSRVKAGRGMPLMGREAGVATSL